MPSYEITDEQLETFGRSLLTIWKSIGQSPPSLNPEREHAREVSRGMVAGMLMTIHQLFGPEELESIKRYAEGKLTEDLGYIPSIVLESADALVAYMAAMFGDWGTPRGI
jgi:hypothetical protein